jgi:hypothetical protein
MLQERMNKMKNKTIPSSTRARAVKRSLLFGALSTGLYAAIFFKADVVNAYFCKGGAYCLLPVATVFLFSYVHGSLASNVWTALGIVASGKTATKTVRKDVRVNERASRPRPRATVNM